MNRSTPFKPSDVLIIYSPDAHSRSIHPYLQKPAKATNQLLSMFFFRSVDAWNAFATSLVFLSNPSGIQAKSKTVGSLSLSEGFLLCGLTLSAIAT
jgi:hypothetical protein